MNNDARQVEPQRVVLASGTDADACAYRYWCRTRITVVALAALLVVAGGVGLWWWTR